MKKVFKIVLALVALGALAFFLRSDLLHLASYLRNKYLPCSAPITYSLGTFDNRFGISKKDFLDVIDLSKRTWEKSIDKELFTYDPSGNGELKINLIYDIRQEASQKLKNIGITVNDTKASYDNLKSKYDSMYSQYMSLKNELQSRVDSFKARQDAYEKEVNYLNDNGGATKEQYTRLNNEKKYLDMEYANINSIQANLNNEISDINALAVVLNRLVGSLNLEVKKYNTIGSELPGEFEEGNYSENGDQREIDVYQFEDKGKLARVLTHEFGHALGLGHLDNPKAVMYRLNDGVNEKLAIDDIIALRKRCGLSAL